MASAIIKLKEIIIIKRERKNTTWPFNRKTGAEIYEVCRSIGNYVYFPNMNTNFEKGGVYIFKNCSNFEFSSGNTRSFHTILEFRGSRKPQKGTVYILFLKSSQSLKSPKFGNANSKST